MLPILHPEVAWRDCDHCQKYEYDGDGQLALFHGQPLLRESQVPCRTTRGCPKGTPEKPNTLTPENRLCYELYERCQLTGKWPDDDWFLECAITIRRAERAAWEIKSRQQEIGPTGSESWSDV